MVLTALLCRRIPPDHARNAHPNAFCERNVKKMKQILRRCLSLVLAFVLVIGMAPVHTFATERETEPVIITEESNGMETTPIDMTEEATTVPQDTEPQETESTVPAEETVEMTEETTPSVEETVEVTTDATEETVEEVTEATEETTEPEEQEIVSLGTAWVVPDVDLPDDEELFQAYAMEELYGYGIAGYGAAAGQTLTGDTKLAYDALKTVISEIASGQRTSASIMVGADLSAYGFPMKTDVAVNFATQNFTSQQLSDLLAALLADMPYELYWFDKTQGVGAEMYAAGDNLAIIFHFVVNKAFRASDENSVDTAKTGAARTAATTAKSVVESVSGTDYEILVAYKDWICSQVSYNTDAAKNNSFSSNSNPWQLIYVFDGDPSTNVVCEGYSKAFQYLCDLTEFTDPTLICYNVSGSVKSARETGPHMWNLVSIGGKSYLADVTNSDAGTVGQNGGLFLVGGTPEKDGSYTFSNVNYTYGEETTGLWSGTELLTLATSNYTPEEEPESNEPYLSVNWVNYGDNGYYEDLSQPATKWEDLDELEAYTYYHMVLYLNTWDKDAKQWVATPVKPTSGSSYVGIESITDFIAPGEKNKDYFVEIYAHKTLDEQVGSILVNGKNWELQIGKMAAGIFNSTTPTLDTMIEMADGLQLSAEGENAFYWILLDTEAWKCVEDPKWTVDDFGKDVTGYLDGEDAVTMTKISDTVWKFVLNPKLVNGAMADRRNFFVQVSAKLQNLKQNYTITRITGCNCIGYKYVPPVAQIQLNENYYYFFEDGTFYCMVPSGEVGEDGYEYYVPDYNVALPQGVSYVPSTNTLTLDNATLDVVYLAYQQEWRDDQGNVEVTNCLPNENLTLKLLGSNTIRQSATFTDNVKVTVEGGGALTMESLFLNGALVIKDGKLALTETGNITIGSNGSIDGTIEGAGEVEISTLDELKQYLTKDEYGYWQLKKSVIITKSMNLGDLKNLNVYGSITVAKNVTLTVPVDFVMSVIDGAQITVEKGGKLVNNGLLSIYTVATSGGFVHVNGTYTHGADATVYVDWESRSTVTGIPTSKQILELFAWTDTEVVSALKDSSVSKYKGLSIYIRSMTLTENVTIPKNVALNFMGEDNILRLEGNVVVNGVICVPENNSLINDGTITLNSGSMLAVYGSFRGNAPISKGGEIQPQAKKIAITKPEETTIDVYETRQIQLTVTADEGALPFVTWTSSNKNIVNASKITYDAETGTYTVPFSTGAVGKVTLTATSIDGGKASAKLTLTTTYLNSVKKLSASVDETTNPKGLQPGESITMSVFTVDADGNKQVANAEDLTFTSSNKSLATVDENGVIKAKSGKTGTVTITVSIKNDPKKRKATVKIPVIAAQKTALTLEHRVEGQETGDAFTVDLKDLNNKSYSFKIYPQVEYADFIEKQPALTSSSFTWTSSNTKLATVKANSDGSATVTIKAKAHGTCVITAVAKDLGKVKATVNVTVKDYTPVLAKSSLTLNPMKWDGVSVELKESWGNTISDVSIADKRLAVKYNRSSGLCVITPADSDTVMKNATIRTKLNVQTEMGSYSLSLTVTAKSSVPTVTIKQTGSMDLLVGDKSNLVITATAKNVEITDMIMTGTDDFRMTFEPTTGKATIDYTDTFLAAAEKRKPDTTATVRLYLAGYRYPVDKAVTIKTTTSKVSLASTPTSSVVNTKLTKDYYASFYIQDKTAKKNLTDLTAENITCSTGNWSVKDGLVTVHFDKAFKGTLSVNVKLDGWLKSVKLTHQITVKTTNPVAKLGTTKLKLNTSFPLYNASTTVSLDQGNVALAGFSDFVSTAKAGSATYNQAQLLTVKYEDGKIYADWQGEERPKNGTYSFKATPYVLNSDGEKVELKAVTVSVNVVSTEPTVKLASTSVQMNKKKAGTEVKTVKATMTNGTGYDLKLVGFQIVNPTEDVEFKFVSGTGIQLKLNSNTNIKHTYTLHPVVYDSKNNEEKVLTKTIKLTVQSK